MEKRGKDNNVKRQHVIDTIVGNMDPEKLSADVNDKIKKDIGRCCSEIAKKWQDCRRTKKLFLSKHAQWLDTHHFQLPSTDTAAVEDVEAVGPENLPSTSTAGRPALSFHEGGERTKRRKTQELREKYSSSELAFATKMRFRSEGKADAAKLLHEAMETTPTRPSRMREAWLQSGSNIIKPYSPDEALALFIDTRLTKSQYIKIRVQAKSRNANIYPSYQHIVAAKKNAIQVMNVSQLRSLL